MKYLISLIIAVSGIYFPSASTAQVSRKIKRVLKRELGEMPDIIVYGDYKKLRNTSYYSILSPLMKTAINNSGLKCGVFTPQNIDSGILAISNISKPKIKGILVVKGTFSTSKFFKCMVKKNKLKKTNYMGFSAYSNKKKSEFYFSPSMGAIVSITGKWKKNIRPNHGILGNGKMRSLSSNKLLECHVNNLPKSSHVKSLKGQINMINGELKFFADLKLFKRKDIKTFKSLISFMMMSPHFKPFKNDFSIQYSGKRAKITQMMDLTQFTLAVNIAKKLFFKNRTRKIRKKPKPVPYNGPRKKVNVYGRSPMRTY